MAKARIKTGKVRIKSKGGRPRKEGERYPSGGLKPVGPNPVTLERRRALCDDITMATCPIDVALANRWISEDHHRTAMRYRRDHAVASLQGPSVPTQKDQSVPQGVDARAMRFANLSDAEIGAIWDSAMRRTGSDGVSQASQAAAMKSWKVASGAMSAEERNEVNDVVLLDSWPQWIIQRRAGRFDTSWERNRALLICGLEKIQHEYERPRAAA